MQAGWNPEPSSTACPMPLWAQIPALYAPGVIDIKAQLFLVPE